MVKPADKKLEKLANKQLFRMVKHGATIDIGSYDDDDTAYPEAYASKWDGECWLKISHEDKTKVKKGKKARESIKDGKLEIEIDIEGTGRKHIFREGSLEWDIEYATVDDFPDDDIERFQLEFPYDQLTFTEQKELTQTEIDDGKKRPENVINSFVGKFDKANKLIDAQGNVIYDYGTGRYCQIYRSKIIAADGAEIWISQNIVNHELQPVIPRQWCIDHGFPVILDPNIGFTEVGGSLWRPASAYRYGVKYTSGVAGTLDSMSIAWSNPNASFDRIIGLGLYEGTTPGSTPDAGEILSDAQPVGYDSETDETNGFMEVDFSSLSHPIPGTTDHWLAMQGYNGIGTGIGEVDIYYDSGSESWRFHNPWDSPWTDLPSTSSKSDQVSVFFTYTAAGAAATLLAGYYYRLLMQGED